MYQCAPGTEAVTAGWSVFGVSTEATTVLSNTCSSGGAIGDYAFTNGQAGAVTENGSDGSEVALEVAVPGSAPDVAISSISADVTASSVTGDDAYLGFNSDGQSLSGVELPYGGGNYSTSESWTLPQGARDFEAYVNCTTDHSSPTCDFADSTAVPALSDVTLTLNDSTPPAVTSVSGSLASAAAGKSTVTGSQTLNFTGTDADSGVRSATLTLSPQGGGAPYTHTFDFSADCAYDSWNACPLTQTVSAFTIDTSALKDGSYAVNLSVTDAAGNSVSDPLGTITSRNAPENTSLPTILVPGEILVGTTLSTQPGAWSAPAGAGTIAYSYQWEQCDSQGNNCEQIAGAQNATYTPAPSDIGHTLRLLVTATDSEGSAVVASAPTSTILSATGSLGALPGPGTSNTNSTAGSSTGTSPGPGATVGAGAANGTFASETAQLHLGSPRIGRWKVTHCSYAHQTISCPYTYRAFTAVGRLLDSQGRPIASATLDILQQVAGSQSSLVITHTKTRPDGTFAVRVPAGPSRLVDVAYRAFSGDADYAAQAKIQEQVKAAIQLTITPQDTSPEGTILLTGKVLGPIPSQGVIVELIVYYHRHWEPFRTPRTDAAGEFQAVYQFEGSIGRFPFQAKTPAGQAGFPFVVGYSKEVHVTSAG